MRSDRKGPQESSRRQRPATTPEGRENQLIAMAIDLAAKQLREGTASSQVIAHFLKLGSSKDRREQDLLDKQIELIEAKTESIKSAKNMEELFTKAIDAMKIYSGNRGAQDD